MENVIVEGLKSSIVSLLAVSALVIYFIIRVERELSEVKKFISVKVPLFERYVKFIEVNFPTIERAVIESEGGSLNRIFNRIIFETDAMGRKLDENFTNGSSIQKAFDDLGDYQACLIDFINNAPEIRQPFRYIWLVDVLVDNIQRLIKELDYMIDPQMKYKLINPYITGLYDLVKFFQGNFEIIDGMDSEKSVKEFLQDRFKSHDSRRKIFFQKKENPVL